MAWRSERHHLQRRASREKMLDVIAQIGGLHAQLLSSAELTVWARVDSLSPQDGGFPACAPSASGRFQKSDLPATRLDSPVLLVDGRMDGVWRYERKGKRLAEFLGGALELTWR
jgi:hypothetical protein